MDRRSHRVTLILALLLTCASQVSAAYSAETSQTNPATAPCNWTWVEMVAVAAPRPFRGTEGKFNLVYEIVLTNYSGKPVPLKAFQVTDSQNEKNVLLSINEKEIPAVLTNCDGTPPKGVLKGGTSSIMWVNIELDEVTKIPATLSHKITYEITPPNKKSPESFSSFLELPVEKKSPVVISSPLAGGKWVAVGGYAGVAGHRRCLFPMNNQLKNAQRYAIDWIKFDDKNRIFTGDKSSVKSFPCYGEPVYAVADGTVVGTINRFENQPPFIPSGDPYYPGGNSITLKIGDNAYAFFAHLQKDSIKVKEGDRVVRGQEIARLGNTGNSTSPHLHFHVTDEPNILASNSVPYVFDNFTINGDVADLKKFLSREDSTDSIELKSGPAYGQRTEELPREGAVVTFSKPE